MNKIKYLIPIFSSNQFIINPFTDLSSKRINTTMFRLLFGFCTSEPERVDTKPEGDPPTMCSKTKALVTGECTPEPQSDLHKVLTGVYTSEPPSKSHQVLTGKYPQGQPSELHKLLTSEEKVV